VGGGGGGGAGGVPGGGGGQGEEMNQALYAHMNNKRKKRVKQNILEKFTKIELEC
jgi:hypothetical protein